MIQHKQIFIDGKWVDSSGTDVLAVINPVTEETIATVPRGTAEDVDRAVQAAAKAFLTWSGSPIEKRAEIFRKLARLTEARSEAITRTIVSELGYPAAQAAHSQVAGAVEELDLIAQLVGEIVWVEQVGNTQVRREPSGVLGAITAWNGPLRP
jgi:acyl-CoA reductase-like NAD-dependent aldehyde dehydrogenase